MDGLDTKKMLALLLTLRNLGENLHEDEKAALKNIGQQLKLDPNDKEFIEDNLMAIIEANFSLQYLYQSFINQLNNKNYNSLLKLLPTEVELEKELPDNYCETRGYFQGVPDLESDEISNVTVVVLTNDDPAAISKNLSFIERIQRYLSQNIENK